MKILYVTTISNTMTFFTSHINMLLDEGHTVDMACNLKRPVDPNLLDRGCNVYNIGFLRSPLKVQNYFAYQNLKKLIKQNNYDVIHTHTPVASVCARLACKNTEKSKVIYTAHGFHFYKGAPIKNWLLYYPIEYWLSNYTDLLITINKEDYNRAKKSFKANDTVYVPGVGLDTKKFSKTKISKSEKRREMGLPLDSFVVLSVGELNKNKNHEVIIKAIAKLKNPNVYYIICGQGALKEYLRGLAKEFGVEDKVRLLGFRNDVVDIYKASDIFAFPSLREGLPVSLMEAMAAGLPIICSRVRGNTDLIENGKGGYLVQPNDANEFKSKMIKLIDNSELRKDMISYNLAKVKKYDTKAILEKMNILYSNILYRQKSNEKG